MTAELNKSATNQRPRTKKEIAAYFSVSERTIDRWLLEGTLPRDAKVVIGGVVRFNMDVLERHMRERSE
ncbi:hypothetical protein RMSM_03560 [Rhodopirellula maiorica SM1]|uniref:Helix-turn-helix domain-containing protein n=1 Tax=Rhodopirellula maiorica SM1 TaxID=1265738 RepID=M5S025_9BACT|nr:helix-turn-helix domain-containing protein [Rhodopirellula maiorica]EMI19529.1 hypothetical protein RMSM_03560 [Rhodopirellula maiorica SM1]